MECAFCRRRGQNINSNTPFAEFPLFFRQFRGCIRWSSGFSRPGVFRLRRRPEPANRVKAELQPGTLFLRWRNSNARVAGRLDGRGY